MTSQNKNGITSWGILIFSSAGAYEEKFLIDCNSAEEKDMAAGMVLR